MIIVRVERWSAVTGDRTELARMVIDNIGGTNHRRNYRCRTLKGRCTAALNGAMKTLAGNGKGVQREGTVTGHLSLREHVWNLVAKALASMDYGEKPESRPAARPPVYHDWPDAPLPDATPETMPETMEAAHG